MTTHTVRIKGSSILYTIFGIAILSLLFGFQTLSIVFLLLFLAVLFGMKILARWMRKKARELSESGIQQVEVSDGVATVKMVRTTCQYPGCRDLATRQTSCYARVGHTEIPLSEIGIDVCDKHYIVYETRTQLEFGI